MSIQIRDHRHYATGLAIKNMPDGTWFVSGFGLYLKLCSDTCVDVATSKRANFSEEHRADPVEVEVMIVRNLH